MPHHSIVADVGGTNTRVAISQDGSVLPDSIRKFANADHDSLTAILRMYCADNDTVEFEQVAVAIAGPVRDGQGSLTNLDWTIDCAALSDATGASDAHVLNDLQAQAHAVGRLDAKFVEEIRPGSVASPEAAHLVVGIGTGFNSAVAYHAPGGRLVPPAESGHATLPVCSEDQFAFAQYAQERFGHAAIEDALSGRGLGHCHDWLRHVAGQPTGTKSAQIFAEAEAGDAMAKQAIDLFSRFLGTVLGDLTLTSLPFGGVYLVGGMSRAIAPWLGQTGFEAAWQDKGRFGPFLDQFPIRLVTDDYAALTGCAGFLEEFRIAH
ncbi:glucokinase [Aliiroseovarius halocynthiae]|uniref:ROK family protein n=1 Tax=Aliiroseovarius halocynthiae TaxID=985055 RepID=A0A545SWM1_9RHOB|nr:ROK family protein [Aliiroseovarius halocynthiae]TQV69372.1 ROK family protein [Aliiroseovarius halocynthiae]SMR72642.1 glucokinase [Aliiroseovarius halocynthiae]